jgi:hypothetical protein
MQSFIDSLFSIGGFTNNFDLRWPLTNLISHGWVEA